MVREEAYYDRARGQDEPRYIISVAARMLDMETYQLRYYEKIGIVGPRRSQGNIRLYSDVDIALLRRVKSLVDEMDVNLAGVEVILRMLQHIEELQGEMEQMRTEIRRQKGR